VVPAPPATHNLITVSRVNTVLEQYERLMRPYDDFNDQRVILTSVSFAAAGNATIRWQYAGGGTLGGPRVVSVVNNLAASAITPAVRGTPATFNATINTILTAYPLPNGASSNMIVGEFFYAYQPVLFEALNALDAFFPFSFNIPPQVFVSRSFMAPRNGVLTALPPSFP
jgi:hypothetical protein